MPGDWTCMPVLSCSLPFQTNPKLSRNCPSWPRLGAANQDPAEPFWPTHRGTKTVSYSLLLSTACPQHPPARPPAISTPQLSTATWKLPGSFRENTGPGGAGAGRAGGWERGLAVMCALCSPALGPSSYSQATPFRPSQTPAHSISCMSDSIWNPPETSVREREQPAWGAGTTHMQGTCVVLVRQGRGRGCTCLVQIDQVHHKMHLGALHDRTCSAWVPTRAPSRGPAHRLRGVAAAGHC
jgi:hypothetical protein